MFEKLVNTGKNLANLGLNTVNQVVRQTLNPDHAPSENDNSTDIHRTEKTSVKPSVFAMKNNLLRQAELKGQDFVPSYFKKRGMKTGSWIPGLRFTTVGSNQVIDLRTLHQPAVLFISHKENAEIAAEWNSNLLSLFYPDKAPIFTANVIVLDEIPLLAHPFVRHELRKAYDTIVQKWLNDPEVAARWVHILPDWDAEIVHALHLVPQRPMLSIAILSPQGRLETVIESSDPLPEIKTVLSNWIQL